MQKKAQVQKLFKDYHDCINEILSTEDLLKESMDDKDQELQQMLEEELLSLRGTDEEYGTLEELQDQIVEIILPRSEQDENNKCTMEIMQAAGGSESSLFAEDILKMYQNYCRRMGYSMKQETF